VLVEVDDEELSHTMMRKGMVVCCDDNIDDE